MEIIIIDSNILFQLEYGGLVDAAFSLKKYKMLTTSLIFENEVRRNYLCDRGLEIRDLSEYEVSRLEMLAAIKRPGGAYAPGKPDISTFVLAESLNAKLITGDAGLRTLSEKLGVEVHGLIWFINELFEEKIIDSKQAKCFYEAVLFFGGRLPVEEIEKQLKRFEKSER